MPIVFVHGVNVRNRPGYSDNLASRRAFFTRFLPEVCTAGILDPLWGEHGVKFAWNQASVPGNKEVALGSSDELPLVFLNEAGIEVVPERSIILLSIARRSMSNAISLLGAVILENAHEEQASMLAALAPQILDYLNFIKHCGQPDWLEEVDNDSQFLQRFEQEVEHQRISASKMSIADGVLIETANQWVAFGTTATNLWDQIKRAALSIPIALSDKTGQLVIHTLKLRPPLHDLTATFTGDIFTYLNTRGTADEQGQIVTLISTALKQAGGLRSENREKLVVVAHSMGGNIVYDILTYFNPTIEVDILITVGSQVSLFEEMKLFKSSVYNYPENPKVDRLPKPKNIKHWINIFDPNDVLSFAITGVFNGKDNKIRDVPFSTGGGVLISHLMYFSSMGFYHVVGELVKEILRDPNF